MPQCGILDLYRVTSIIPGRLAAGGGGPGGRGGGGDAGQPEAAEASQRAASAGDLLGGGADLTLQQCPW